MHEKEVENEHGKSAGYLASQKELKKRQNMKEMGEMAKKMGLKTIMDPD